jgi:hypothetical protein
VIRIRPLRDQPADEWHETEQTLQAHIGRKQRIPCRFEATLLLNNCNPIATKMRKMPKIFGTRKRLRSLC